MRLVLAFQAFFGVLFNQDFAKGVKLLQSPDQAPSAPPKAPQEPAPTSPAKPAPPARSDAITLLSALQREARFVDIVTESLDAYSDAQIGAAARDVLRDSGKVIQRMFAVQPVANEAEGSEIEIPAGYDTGQYRLTGNLAGEPPLTGKVAHAGWKATKCELPKWTGTADSAKTIAPAEVQIA